VRRPALEVADIFRDHGAARRWTMCANKWRLKAIGQKIFIFSTPVRFAFPVRLGVEGQRSADPADREPWT
jgi:hypothetical protein